jgi:hypothetical protein
MVDHTRRCGHVRAGMIPRWKQDNDLAHLRDIARAVKNGRGHWYTDQAYDNFGKSC